jgi:hypothetical protein
MIAEAPLAAGSQFTDVVNAARAYITTAKVAARDGLTWVEFGELLVGLLRLCSTSRGRARRPPCSRPPRPFSTPWPRWLCPSWPTHSG